MNHGDWYQRLCFAMKHGGFEPPTTWLKVRCSTDWASAPYFFTWWMPRTGIEPVTRGFSVLCSTNWAIWALSSGDRIWTYDLRVMSPTSFQTAPPRDINIIFTPQTVIPKSLTFQGNGWRWIRTTEAICSRFTVCPLWPLGNPPIKPMIGLEPITCWLQISCSANWATSASRYSQPNGTYRARTCDPLLVRQMLSQLS